MRRFAPFLFACLLAILTTVPASAARPERFVIDVSDPAFEADTEAFLVEAFGPASREVVAGLTRPRLSYNVAVYHRSRRDPEPES